MRNIFKRSPEVEAHSVSENGGLSINVLAVESDVDFLRHLKSMVSDARMPDNTSYLKIASAGSLREAIDILSEQRFDIILTDINLEDASGFLVLEELMAFSNRAPIIVLSNITNWSMIMEESAQAGISDFLLKKTLDPGILMRSIFYAIERNRLEIKVNRSENTYRSLVDILPLGLFRADTAGVLTYVNQVFCDLLNVSEDTVMNRPVIRLFQDESGDKVQHALGKVLKENAIHEFEIAIREKEGASVSLLCIGAPLHDDMGIVVGVQVVVVDFRNQKQVQSEKNATQVLGALQSGLSKMSNEMNNAMASILLDAENLLDSNPEGPNHDVAERIIHDVQEARSVFRPFLVSAQEVGPRSELLDPYRILKTTLDEIKQELPDRVQMVTHIPDHPEYIKADASLFVKMIRNIVNNASESMEEPGIIKVIADVIVLDSESGTADALDLLPGRYIHLVISDQGSGLPSHMIQRAFEPFYTSKEKPHAGLGLTETLGIAKSHKGNIKLESALGRGSQFHVYLPIIVCKAAEDSVQEQAIDHDLDREERTILVVDDEENFLLSIAIRLKKFGYQVITANNGADALSKYNEHQTEIDLVITDNYMPVMDGPALIHALRQLAPSLKIILCTGLETEKNMNCEQRAEIAPFPTV